MNIAKSLILGSAATLVALGGAQAADLPLKAKAVEYVKVCSLYGAGFYYIPGTDTCIKLGGYVMADTTFNGAGAYDMPRWTGNPTRYSNDYISRSRLNTTIDTRTATEYGVVRTFASLVYSFTTDTSSRAGGELGVYYAFIQFAGFTFGKAVSQFDMPWSGYPGNQTSFLLGGYDDVTGVNQIAYTAQFGNGVSASISLEDSSGLNNRSTAISSYTRAPLWDLGAGGLTLAGGTNNWAGAQVPDIIGQLRVDQAWGLFQLSAAAHQLRVGEPIVSAVPSDAWGFAVQAGLSLKNLPTGAGDSINVSAGYSNGASRYIIGGVSPDSYAIGNSSVLAVGFSSDGAYGPGFGIQKTEAWGVRGAFNHNWDPYWSSSLFGSYSGLRYNNTVKNFIGFNPDWEISQIGVVTRWTPVKNLTLSGEAMYTYLTQHNTGALLPNGAIAGDRGTWSFSVRARRDF
ncbi:MAG: porin [Rhizobiales bacterium]|nr:porin [Hyphomicrobiales bacterium]